MTLEEAIEHCEEVAEEQDMLAKRCDDASGYTRSHNEAIRTEEAKKHCECANEHRQLAEWLRELKKWRVIKEGIYSLCDIDCEYPQYKEKKTMCDACMIGQVIDHLERVFEEVKVDDR